MKNYGTTHRSKCAATCRVQLILNHYGENTISLPGIAEIFFIINLHTDFPSPDSKLSDSMTLQVFQDPYGTNHVLKYRLNTDSQMLLISIFFVSKV